MIRKLLPLAILEAAGDGKIEGITRFQKLVFLAQREQDGEQPYDFEPKDYGPFSKDLYDDLDLLVTNGFVDRSKEQTELGNEKQVYELTEKGRRAVERARKEDEEFPINVTGAEQVLSEYGDMSLWKLLEYVYETYPSLARNSELSI